MIPDWEHGQEWHQAPGRRVRLRNIDQARVARGETADGARPLYPDRDPWHHGDLGTVVTVDKMPRPFRTTILLDRTGDTIECTSPGMVERVPEPDEIARARANATAAGFVFGRQNVVAAHWYCATDAWGWWGDMGYTLGMTEPTPDDPAPVPVGLCDAYGHDWPPCQECGSPRSATFAGANRATRWCFGCGFWIEKIGDPSFIRCADGAAVCSYHVRTHGIRSGDRNGLGFGGAVLRFRMLADGREIVSNDVFTQGEVPERFWDRLPINAERIRASD